jgi:hypothetical protein
VGVVGIQSTGFYVDGESGHAGVRFGGDTLTPRQNGADADNEINLGQVASRFNDLHMGGKIAASNSSSLQFGSTSCAIEGTSSGADYIKITTNSSERMRIDSSGNLLVGRTSNNWTTAAGFTAQSNGAIIASRADASGFFNRLSTYGDIMQFAKDGTTVGGISAQGSGMVFYSSSIYTGIGGSATNPYYWLYNGAIYPTVDNSRDLGTVGNRFDDVYATNPNINTSDRNEKQDIAELSDAEQRVAVAAKGLLRKFRWKDAVAEKGDKARTHFGIIAQDLQAAFAAEGLDAGDYAMFISSTWTDEETGEERTRMGVRYSELLAFIISAI